MHQPVSCIISVTEGLPFGPSWLTEALAPSRVWSCRFDLTFYQDDDFAAQGILMPPSLAGSPPKRCAEYLAGRIAADRMLLAIGHSGIDVPPGEDRAPCWPVDVQGSISHNASLALCIGRRRPDRPVSGLGIDIETLIAAPRTLELWPGIISVAERELLAALPLPFAVGLTLAFSAKESLFKALYPIVLRYFDFLDARVIQLGENRITLELTIALAPSLPAGMRFTCFYAIEGDEVLTLLSV